jgi:hypothetical protein
VARPLPQPQPQPRLQSQPQSQPQPEADARARADAQHAKAKHAQTEFRRLQHHFAQLQQHDRVKDPGRARLLPPRQGTPVGPGQLDTLGERDRASGHRFPTSSLKAADPNFVWPSREQEQQTLQAQLAAAAVQQASKQLLQQAGKALMSTTRPIVSPPSQPLTPHTAHLGPPRAPAHSDASQAPAYTPVRLLPSQRLNLYDARTTMFLLGTTSSAPSKSPASFSTRTRRPWQQWRRTRRCGRRAGHACALFVAQ